MASHFQTDALKKQLKQVEEYLSDNEDKFGDMPDPNEILDDFEKRRDEINAELNEEIRKISGEKEKFQQMLYSASGNSNQDYLVNKMREIQDESDRVESKNRRELDKIKAEAQHYNDHVFDRHQEYIKKLKMKEILEEQIKKNEQDLANGLEPKSVVGSDYKGNILSLSIIESLVGDSKWRQELKEKTGFEFYKESEDHKFIVFRNKKSGTEVVITDDNVFGTYNSRDPIEKIKQDLEILIDIYLKSGIDNESGNRPCTSNNPEMVQLMEEMLARKLIERGRQNDKINGKTLDQILPELKNLAEEKPSEKLRQIDVEEEIKSEKELVIDNGFAESKYDYEEPFQTNGYVIHNQQEKNHEILEEKIPHEESFAHQKEKTIIAAECSELGFHAKAKQLVGKSGLEAIARVMNADLSQFYKANHSLRAGQEAGLTAEILEEKQNESDYSNDDIESFRLRK